MLGKVRKGLSKKEKKVPPKVVSRHEEGCVRVYTDGACTNNGKRGALAGWGVHFPDKEFPDMCGALTGSLQTNQRAELTAILMALEKVIHSSPAATTTIKIYSDSQYSIKCFTEWITNWKRNGWKNAKKQPVLNMDLIQKVDKLLTGPLKGRVSFVHVRGHSGDELNEIADRLAVEGASRQVHTADLNAELAVAGGTLKSSVTQP